MAGRLGHPRRLYLVDRDPRGSLPRAARLGAGSQPQCAFAGDPQVFYLLTCEYCFSHYVAIAFLIITRFKLLYPVWRGYPIFLFSLVWLANIYMGIFGQVKLGVKKERAEIKSIEKDVEVKEREAA
jgi:hypothetical protein